MVLIKTHGAQCVPLTTAGGGEHFRTPLPGQLHRSHAYPTGSRVHQHRFPGTDRGQIHQPVQGRHKRHRHARGLGKRPPPRQLDQPLLVHHRQRTRPVDQSHHRVTNGQTSDLRTGLDHYPGAFCTQHRGLARVHPQRRQHIPEIDPGRCHRQPHLPGLQRCLCLRAGLDHQILERPAASRQPPRRLLWR